MRRVFAVAGSNSYVVISVLTLTGVCLAAGVYSGGAGTPENPYIISNASDLNQIGLETDDLDKCFQLVADVNCSSIQVDSFNVIGNDANRFSGVFDGGGYRLENFRISVADRSYVGLFGCIGSEGIVRDIEIVGAVVNSLNGTYVSILAGFSYGSIDNCQVSGRVGGMFKVGGIAGQNQRGVISRSFSNCQVEADTNAGVLCGLNNYGSLLDSGSEGRVSCPLRVGGLAGMHYEGDIERCYAICDVEGDAYAGGLCGYMSASSTVVDSFSGGQVHGVSDVGGLIGYIDRSSIEYSHSYAAVIGSNRVGGMVGGRNQSVAVGCFWDVESSGMSYSALGDGRDTIDMHSYSTFWDAGWDFQGEDENGLRNAWRMCAGEADYPRLAWQALRGDIGCPTGVNFEDFSLLAQWWLREDCETSYGCRGADVDGSGDVGQSDLAELRSNWLTQ